MVTATTAQPVLIRSDKLLLGGAAALIVLAGLANYGGWASGLGFVLSAAAMSVLAALVGLSVEQLGDRFGPGATGVLQSALGNLPELFICIFSLRAGLVEVVQAALIGSILANLLLVLGLAGSTLGQHEAGPTGEPVFSVGVAMPVEAAAKLGLGADLRLVRSSLLR